MKFKRSETKVSNSQNDPTSGKAHPRDIFWPGGFDIFNLLGY